MARRRRTRRDSLAPVRMGRSLLVVGSYLPRAFFGACVSHFVLGCYYALSIIFLTFVGHFENEWLLACALSKNTLPHLANRVAFLYWIIADVIATVGRFRSTLIGRTRIALIGIAIKDVALTRESQFDVIVRVTLNHPTAHIVAPIAHANVVIVRCDGGNRKVALVSWCAQFGHVERNVRLGNIRLGDDQGRQSHFVIVGRIFVRHPYNWRF